MSIKEKKYHDSETLTSNAWQWVRLEEVCEINPRRTISSDRSDTAPTTFIPMAAVDERAGIVARSETKPYGEVKKGYTFFTEGDVLFAKITPCMQNGKHAVVRETVDGIGFASTEFHVLRPNLKVTGDWIHFFLRQRVVLQAAMTHFTGAVGQQRVPQEFLASLRFPLPPREEQKRLSIILNEQLAAVEQARAAAEAQLKAAKELPAAYLREVFSSPEAQKWPRKRLGESCLLLPSKSIATNGNTNVRAITTACLTEMGFDPSGVKHARMWAKDAAECVVSSGEILIARSNTPELVGRVAMFTGSSEKAVASDLTIRIWPRDGILSPFLTGYLASLYMDGYWKDRAGGASGSMKKITRTQIENEQIPVPLLKTQQHVASLLAEKMEAVSRLRRILGERLATINLLPATLLRQAFNGEL